MTVELTVQLDSNYRVSEVNVVNRPQTIFSTPEKLIRHIAEQIVQDAGMNETLNNAQRVLNAESKFK